jgi:hypothetical protein
MYRDVISQELIDMTLALASRDSRWEDADAQIKNRMCSSFPLI